MNKKIIAGVVGALVIAGGSFYGGTVYQKSQGASFARGQFANAQFMGTGAAGARTARAGMGGAFTVGQILSKDENSITVKLQDGSTKIVLVGDSTAVMKSASGTLNDLVVGTNVTVTGSTNSDGSITAQSVQIRPATPAL